MDLRLSISQLSTIPFLRTHSSSPNLSADNSSLFSLPFPNQNAKFHKELEVAVDVVEKSCRLCVDVKKSLFSSEGQLGKLFPSIPLVVEEDSGFLRSNNLVGSVVSAVSDKVANFLRNIDLFHESDETEFDALLAEMKKDKVLK